jgi:hypothetical protein
MSTILKNKEASKAANVAKGEKPLPVKDRQQWKKINK